MYGHIFKLKSQICVPVQYFVIISYQSTFTDLYETAVLYLYIYIANPCQVLSVLAQFVWSAPVGCWYPMFSLREIAQSSATAYDIHT